MTQLLDLSALERDTIKLADGTDVQLRNPEEFSVVDDYRLRALITVLATVDVASITDEDKANEASEKLHQAAALLAVDLPEGADDATCAALFKVWIDKHITNANPRTPNRRSRRTTAKSSPGSKRSTAARRKTGSRKSRGTS